MKQKTRNFEKNSSALSLVPMLTSRVPTMMPPQRDSFISLSPGFLYSTKEKKKTLNKPTRHCFSFRTHDSLSSDASHSANTRLPPCPPGRRACGRARVSPHPDARDSCARNRNRSRCSARRRCHRAGCTDACGPGHTSIDFYFPKKRRKKPNLKTRFAMNAIEVGGDDKVCDAEPNQRRHGHMSGARLCVSHLHTSDTTHTE